MIKDVHHVRFTEFFIVDMISFRTFQFVFFHNSITMGAEISSVMERCD